MGGEADHSGRLVNETTRPDQRNERDSPTTMSATVPPAPASNGPAEQRGGSDFSRRDLLKRAGMLGAAAAVQVGGLAPAGAAEPARKATQARAAMPVRESLETLTAAESDTLESIVARLIPTDENGPGAAEARAAHYIDRALTGPLAPSRAAYSAGLAAVDAYPYPNGLSNNHGQVGKHYMTHNTLAGVTALFPWNLNTWYGLPAQGVAVDNWADDNFDHANLDFIGGGNLWVYTERRPIFAASMATFGQAPAWGSAWKAFIKQNADRWNSAYLQKTTLPYEDNYLDLDPAVKDPLGFPVCRITADFKDNEKKTAAFSQDRMVQWYMEAGAVGTLRLPVGTMGPSTHAYGGTRMGNNPDTNVVDRWGFSHEAPNLGVLGASVMGTSGAHNPTLTAQALAWRTAEHLAENWKTIAKGGAL